MEDNRMNQEENAQNQNLQDQNLQGQSPQERNSQEQNSQEQYPQGQQSQVQRPQTQYPPMVQTNGFAIASMILGIISLLTACCTGIGGLFFGGIGIVLALLSRGKEPMENQAKIGLGISIAGAVLGGIILIIAMVVMTSSTFREGFTKEFNNEFQRYSDDYGEYDDYDDYGDFSQDIPEMPHEDHPGGNEL